MTPALILCALLAVTDGDTIRVDCGLGAERVRVAFLDCPEIGQPGGYDAAKAMARLLRGKIELKPRAQTGAVHPKCRRPGYCDHYGRTVASVYSKYRDVARRLIASGACSEHCRYSVSVEFPEGKYGGCAR